MYYFRPPQNNTPPPDPNYAVAQTWDDQRQVDEAMETATQRYKGLGWNPVNIQQLGNSFRVHLLDRSGDYHTVILDTGGNILQNQPGYL